MAEVSGISCLIHYHHQQQVADNHRESQHPKQQESPVTNCPFSNYPIYLHDFDDYPDSVSDMNFVTNLFEYRQDYVVADDGCSQDSIFNPFLDHLDDFGVQKEELGLGFRRDFEVDGAAASGCLNGLRVAGIDSDSDIEEDDGANEVGDDLGFPVLWRSVVFDEQAGGNEEVDNDGDGFSSLIDRIEEITVSSEISSINEEESVVVGEEGVRDLEWEFLLAVNNFSGDIDIEEGDDDDGVTYLAVEDGITYDTLFEQFVEIESVLKGGPPAAKYVVENLPLVYLTKEYVMENTVVCAVCKDDIVAEDRVTRLPCNHHYHGECIVPWLNIRNTCPVCRVELPTDDADYERRKDRSQGLGLLEDLQ